MVFKGGHNVAKGVTKTNFAPVQEIWRREKKANMSSSGESLRFVDQQLSSICF